MLVLSGCTAGAAQINNPAILAQKTTPAQGGTTTTIAIVIPSDFVSEAELILWLEEDGVSELEDVDNVVDWFNKARLIQLNALEDGYIVNVDYDYDSETDTFNVYNTTVIEGTIYYWDPEADELKRDTNLTGVE
jgi:hypothetical protein